MAGEDNKAIREVVDRFLDGLRIGGPGDWREYAWSLPGLPPIPQFQAVVVGDEDARRGFKVLRVPVPHDFDADVKRAVDIQLLDAATLAWIDGCLLVEKREGKWKVLAASFVPLPAAKCYP